MTGVIIRILHFRGYGFIRDEAGVERFVHVSDLTDTALWSNIRVGRKVEFTPIVREPLPTSRFGDRYNGLGVKDVRLLEGD